MFPRFRRIPGNRLSVSVVASVRRGDRVVQEHLWALGSLSPEPSLAERHAFWTRVAEVLAPYAPEQRAPVVAALAARVPPPDVQEMQAEEARLAREQAQRMVGEQVQRLTLEAQRWDEVARQHRAVIAGLQGQIAEQDRAAVEAEGKAQAVREELARLKDAEE
jgi:hypothetical protein